MNRIISLFSLRRLIEYRPKSTRIAADGKEVPKRKNFADRVTLIATDNSVSITDLKNAQNLATKKELKLVKVQDIDAKTRRPIYKLMTTAEYHEEELERRKTKQASRDNGSVKGDKLLTLSSRIGEHDLMTGVKKMMKLLEKQYEVKVVIAGEAGQEQQQSERIFSVIEKNLKNFGIVVQKRSKGNSLRFQLLPAVKNSTSSVEVNETSGKDPTGGEKGPL